jgi:hypothetical protein
MDFIIELFTEPPKVWRKGWSRRIYVVGGHGNEASRKGFMLGHGKEGGRKEGDMVFKGVVMRVVSKKGVCSLSAWQ